MKLLKSVAYSLIFCTALAGPAIAVEPDAPEQLITRLDAVGLEVLKRLTARFSATSESEYEKNEHGALVEYYADHGHMPVWVSTEGLTDRARAAMKEIARAADYGLNPADYPLPKLENAGAGERIPAAKLANAEIMLNHSALAYVRDARGGRIPPQSISYNLDPTLELPDPLAVIEKIAALDDPSDYLRGFHPQHPQFEALRQVMLRIRGGATRDKRIIVPNGPVIRPGQKHPQIAVVRQRLKAPMPEGTDARAAELYDSGLEAAVKEFQKSHGLNAEGIIGPATRRAMNGGGVPKKRLRTIMANMERYRWLSDEKTSGFNVQVNVPEFTIRVLDGKTKVHTERVVVGKVKNQTPIFSDEMEYIVFHPYWNVPNSIKVKEILPNLRRSTMSGGWFGGLSAGNPRFLRAHNLRVRYRGRNVDASSVNWSNVNANNVQFYQPPGGPNVLGFVKFMFPNKHIVYMHDTPTKNLFAQSVRAYSHGCMRIRNPRKLAEILLKRDSGWTPGRVGGAIQRNQNQHVMLQNKIPVHVTYFTARVNPDGSIRYFGDIYGHDAKVARALKF